MKNIIARRRILVTNDSLDEISRVTKIPRTTYWRIKKRGWGWVKYYQTEESRVNITNEQFKNITKIARRYAYKYLHSSSYVEDAIQDVCLRILEQNKQPPDGEVELTKYIITITRHICMRYNKGEIRKDWHCEYIDEYNYDVCNNQNIEIENIEIDDEMFQTLK